MVPGSYPTGQMRASDADRDAVLTALSEHFQAGRLTSGEFDERSGQALAARTMDDLRGLTADLPALQPAQPVPAVPASAPVRSALMPVAVALAAIAVILVVVVSLGATHHGWKPVWLIPVGLLIARRLGRRGDGPLGSRTRHHQ